MSSDSDDDIKAKFDDEDSEEFSNELSSKSKEEKNNKYSSYNEKRSNNHEEEKYNKENFEYGNLIKCFICLNPSINPVICRYCGNIACEKCFSKWLNTQNKCGCCRKYMARNDLIAPPIIGKINEFLNNIKDKVEFDQCKQHKEKYLFYCVNCIKKYCGKCLFFMSEESKKHIGHKILDYEDIKNTKYNDLINELESANEETNKIDVCPKIYNDYKFENKIKFENSNIALDNFKKHIFKEFEEKNNSIDKKIDDLYKIKNKIKETCKVIYNNLQKLENPQKPIEDFDCFKYCEILKNNIKDVTDIENQIEKIQNKNNKIEFKTTYFQIVKTYEEIIKSIKKSLIIKVPINIEIKLADEDDSYFSIIIPEKFTDKNENKIIHLFPVVTFKNKIYNFKRNIIKDEDKNIEENKIKNSNFVTFISVKELDNRKNVFKYINS
jgi:hypothetical protein